MSDTVEDQLRQILGRDLSFHENEFIRWMRLCVDHNIPHGWMSLAVAMEWADKQDGPLARADEAKIMELEAQIAALKRGEYICKKCGLRKDAECERIEF